MSSPKVGVRTPENRAIPGKIGYNGSNSRECSGVVGPTRSAAHSLEGLMHTKFTAGTPSGVHPPTSILDTPQADVRADRIGGAA